MAARPIPPGPRHGLRRHPALLFLSRDHHHALVQALALRQAGAAPAAEVPGAAVDAFLSFHAREMAGHFADEDEVLFVLAAAADPPGVERLSGEHREIDALAAALAEARAGGRDPRALAVELGALIDDHVRFEERSFFEAVQTRLDAGALAHLERALQEHREARGVRAGCARPAR